MNEIVYLEPDNDIVSVIGRIKEVESDHLALVIPRGGTIAQSIVNLKLLKRETEKSGKEISLVTNDKISKNLASQVGISVYDTVNEAKAAVIPLIPVKAENFAEKPIAAEEYITPDGIKINRYNREEEVIGNEDEDEKENKEAESENVMEFGVTKPIDEEKKPETDEKKGKGETVKERVVEKHITHEVIRDSQPEEEKPLLENKNHNINPISPSEVEEYDKKMTPTYAGQRKNLSSRRKPLLIILGVFVLAVLGLSYYLLPKAEASLTLKTDDLQANVEVTIDSEKKEKDLESMTIPGEVISLEKELSKEAAASGKKNIGTKANGNVTFYNYIDVNNPVTIPAGTVIAASGLNFTVDAAVTIPKATATVISLAPLNVKTDPGTVEAKITSSAPGDNYNLAPSKFVVTSFSGEKRDKVYAQSSAKLSGGTTKEATVITEADIAKAKTEISKELSASSSEELNGQAVKDNKKIIASSLKDEEISFVSTGKVDDEASSFSVTLKLKTSASAFSEVSLKDLINEKVKKDIGDTQMIVDLDKMNIEYDVVSTDPAKGLVKILVKYKGKTSKLISKEDVILKIQGKKFGMAKIEAEKIDGVEKAEIKIWPSMLARVPYVKSRINVTFGYQE